VSPQGIEAMASGVIAHYFAHEGRENELEPQEHARRIARDLAAHGLLAKPCEIPPIKGLTVVFDGRPIFESSWEFHPSDGWKLPAPDAAALPDLEPGMSKYDGKPRAMWCIRCDRPASTRPDGVCDCHEHHDGCLCRYWKLVEEEA
jgi:hypothetical protein